MSEVLLKSAVFPSAEMVPSATLKLTFCADEPNTPMRSPAFQNDSNLMPGLSMTMERVAVSSSAMVARRAVGSPDGVEAFSCSVQAVVSSVMPTSSPCMNLYIFMVMLFV